MRKNSIWLVFYVLLSVVLFSCNKDNEDPNPDLEGISTENLVVSENAYVIDPGTLTLSSSTTDLDAGVYRYKLFRGVSRN